MKENIDKWLTARETMRLLMRQYSEPMKKSAMQLGIPEFAWSPIIAARMFAPDPISAKRLRVRIPYNAPVYYEKQLAGLHECGCLTGGDDGDFYLTQHGQEAFTAIITSANKQLENLNLLSDNEIEHLVSILSKLVQFILVTPPPPCRSSILASRKIDQGPQAHPIVRLDQYLTDLSAFRDDAHLAAWSEYRVHPHTWDILGLVWSGRASSFKKITEILCPREWLKDQTVCSIEELISLGWIEGVGEFQLSEEGRSIREAAEFKTNEYFFEPWKILTVQELENIENTLKRFNTELESLVN